MITIEERFMIKHLHKEGLPKTRIDEVGYLPVYREGANFLFQVVAKAMRQFPSS